VTIYYADDLVTLHLGDCLTDTGWTSADTLVTDPPYGISWSLPTMPTAHSWGHPGIVNDQDTAARDAVLALFGQKPGVVFGSWSAPFPADRRQVLTWQKPIDAGIVGASTGYRRDTELIFLTGRWPKRSPTRSSVLTTRGGKASYLTGHPHAKPVALMAVLLDWTEGVIADPFAGSGSTLVAAKQLGRTAIGVEIDERYAEIAARRLSQGVLDFGSDDVTARGDDPRAVIGTSG